MVLTAGRERIGSLLTVLCGAIFLEGVDIAMINVALPSIRADLGLSTGTLQWVMSAYVLGYGGFMLLGGRAADLLGRRRMFLLWLTVFVLFSGLGAIADDGGTLIIARFVTGVAAAFMTPAGLSIITSTVPEGPVRDRALMIYAGTAAAGFSLGLVIGGVLSAIDWRWVFLAPVLFALCLLAAAVRLIPRQPRVARSARDVDVVGAVTITAALVVLVLAVERAPHTSFVSTAAAAVVAIALLTFFVLWERRAAQPLVRLGILRSTRLVHANLTTLLLAAAFFGFQFLAVLYLQEVRGWSTLATSFAMLAIGADAVLAPTLTPRLVARFGHRRVIVAGMLLAVLAYALFLPVGPDWGYAAMFPTMILLGVSFALAYGPLTITATTGVEESEHGLASGLLYTSFQFGAALGLSAVTGALAGGFHVALVVPLISALIAAATALRS
ncbi:MFS transporter [Allokutzneria albata]|uniref:Predicted arabinose efflux permease, MFS family n=1 Tax=Allokutzneria albata TaxID=211114 RepID=A0A1G9TCR8_ALLAB|nr:MFS transporter [Allokutzneria albata]SDM45428.1 Predicted arabinose efflux permease, MFS family [Allokutzneria albata]